jgi:hypothetical protein
MQTRSLLLAAALPFAVPLVARADLSLPDCYDDRDCVGSPDGPMCEGSHCTHCEGPEDCLADMVCEAGACVVECNDDLDCGADKPVCDPDTNVCMQCLDDDDCIASEYCSMGLCFDGLCEPGRVYCASEDQTRTCNAIGSAFGPPVDCPDGFACVQIDPGEDATCMLLGSDGTSTSASSTTSTPSTSDDDDDGIPASSTSGTTSSGSGAVADAGCGCTTAPSSMPALVVLFAARRRGRRPLGRARQ